MSDKITIRYERSGRCFWHIGCKAQHHAPPMRIGADDGARTLIHCTACGESGYYPHGSVGDVCCEPVTAQPAPAAQASECGSNGTVDCQSTAEGHRCASCPHGVGVDRADPALPAAQPADSAMRQAIEALRSAETWLEGWASAEPYLSEIRRALAAFDALEDK